MAISGRQLSLLLSYTTIAPDGVVAVAIWVA
jgi:hypothetical protein